MKKPEPSPLRSPHLDDGGAQFGGQFAHAAFFEIASGGLVESPASAGLGGGRRGRGRSRSRPGWGSQRNGAYLRSLPVGRGAGLLGQGQIGCCRRRFGGAQAGVHHHGKARGEFGVGRGGIVVEEGEDLAAGNDQDGVADVHDNLVGLFGQDFAADRRLVPQLHCGGGKGDAAEEQGGAQYQFPHAPIVVEPGKKTSMASCRLFE